MSATGARALVARAREELADLDRRIRSHRWLSDLEAGAISRDALAAFAGEQLLIIESDRRSFGVLAERFPEPPAGPYFRDMVTGEQAALAALEPLAEATGLVGERRAGYEPVPGCQAYPSYVARLARDGSPGEVATAFLVNLEAWGTNCARAGEALRTRYGFGDDAVRFFDLFAASPPGFEARSLDVIDAWVRSEEDAVRARRAARLLQAYELLYWDSLPG